MFLGPAFGQGAFVAQDGHNSGGNQNFKLVPWENIATAITPNLIIDTGWNPRVWGKIPVLSAEPEVTVGTSNTISWETIVEAKDYYADCAGDENFTNIVSNSGWITGTNYKFTGLELGKCYWYSVKARNMAGIESDWSNVESSLQATLTDAVDIMLAPENLKSNNLKNPLINKIEIASEMINKGYYIAALNKLKNDILVKMDGCVENGGPDRSDWIITCEAQNQIYPLIIETIEHIEKLME